jgi:predicted DsbA family dithiol-disulfide isomerase
MPSGGFEGSKLESTMTTLKIDLYSDIVCPWCLIGQRRLDQVLDKHFPDLEVDIEHHPFMLMPDCPPQGWKTADLLKARGMDPTAMRARPEAEAREVGLTLDLSLQQTLYPTVAGHTLIRHARALGTQHQLAQALEAANFVEARNIADADVLADIAADHGFDRDEAKRLVQSPAEMNKTRQAAADAAELGICGVPYFVFSGGASVSGSQSEEAFVEAIRQATEIISA